jgi:hypothetical protein
MVSWIALIFWATFGFFVFSTVRRGRLFRREAG